MTIAHLARKVAAYAEVFGSRDPVDMQRMRWNHVFQQDEAEIMVDFVRDNPEAPLLAMYNHLRLTKRYPETVVNNADMLALKLFHAAVRAAQDFERIDAAEKAEAKMVAAVTAPWPGEQAFKPQPGPFDPVGLSPTR